ncbi:MAG: hypothetical protein EAX96_06435 [Candidatus Lokiarchaeota archaeon]|nr:hypothetical protein [Candidatus Lokiarchaeota archaeon]
MDEKFCFICEKNIQVNEILDTQNIIDNYNLEKDQLFTEYYGLVNLRIDKKFLYNENLVFCKNCVDEFEKYYLNSANK